jgi:hypothetical protein
MSEQHTNVEIEDVLTSIRRLVSQDLRRPQPPRQEASPSPSAPQADRAVSSEPEQETLVLGPALRVAPPAAPSGALPIEPEHDEAEESGQPQPAMVEEDDSEGPLPEGEGEDPSVSAEQGTTHASADGAQGAVTSDQPFAESEITAQEVQWDQPVGDILGRAVHAGADEFDTFEIEDGLPAPRKDAAAAPMAPARAAEPLAAPLAQFEPELGDPFGGAPSAAQFEADAWVDAEQTEYAAPEDMAHEASEVPEADLAFGGGADSVEDQEAKPSEASPQEGDFGDAADFDLVPDDIWAAEADVMGFTEQDEVEHAREVARVSEGLQRLHLKDLAAPAAAAQPRRPTAYEDIREEVRKQVRGAVNEGGMSDAHDPLGVEGLDVEGLRELVRDMIRQELQGVLGERITRNVRKLVRREIQRALDTEQF